MSERRKALAVVLNDHQVKVEGRVYSIRRKCFNLTSGYVDVYGNPIFQCSDCNEITVVYSYRTMPHSYVPSFCPKCGARFTDK